MPVNSISMNQYDKLQSELGEYSEKKVRGHLDHKDNWYTKSDGDIYVALKNGIDWGKVDRPRSKTPPLHDPFPSR